MKKTRILGIIAAVLAFIVLAVGIVAELAKDGSGAFAGRLAAARDRQTRITNIGKAVKSVTGLEKKLSAAEKSIDSASSAVSTASDEMANLDSLDENDETGDPELDSLIKALAHLVSGTDAAAPYLDEAQDALNDIASGRDIVEGVVADKVLSVYSALAGSATESVNSAQDSISAVWDNTVKIFGLTDTEYDETAFSGFEALPTEFATVEECREAVTLASERATELEGYKDTMAAWFADAAAGTKTNEKLSLGDRIIIALSDRFIGVIFTAALLGVIAVVLLFFAKPFARRWAKDPVFSVFIAMLVMLVAQTYALGFSQGTFGAWAKFWFDNNFNVLRANTSVGMIALGMTLVIITGGIDLAVGSTLAGAGTILMTMIDTGSHGFLVKFSITGLPAYIIGIFSALAFGLAIGAVIGLLVTKGRVPPFIATLGLMNIIRSLCMYFTKSYTATVPKEFEVIANKVILGQRPMTIIYWVILIIIFYLVMKHTAFGRYVYAVGSNERTTMLSGINTNAIKLRVYMILGFVVAIAAVSQLSRLGGMDVASAGNGFELDAIAAVVVGGTAMSGGRGSIIGTVLGVLIIGIMNNLLILLGVDSFLTDAFKGGIVVIAVLMQRKEKLA